jgi:hypothetical protein
MSARYKVIGGFFDGFALHGDGDEVSYKGEPGDNLEPLNAEAKVAKARVGKMARPQPLEEDERQELERLRQFKAASEARADKPAAVVAAR